MYEKNVSSCTLLSARGVCAVCCNINVLHCCCCWRLDVDFGPPGPLMLILSTFLYIKKIYVLYSRRIMQCSTQSMLYTQTRTIRVYVRVVAYCCRSLCMCICVCVCVCIFEQDFFKSEKTGLRKNKKNHEKKLRPAIFSRVVQKNHFFPVNSVLFFALLLLLLCVSVHGVSLVDYKGGTHFAF